MKNLKFLVIGLCALFLTNVSALEVNSFETVDSTIGLKDCLTTETECKLSEDITTSESITLTGSKATLDLNGKTLTLNHTIVVDSNAELTIKGNGEVKSSSNSTLFLVQNGGKLVLDGGNYTSTAYNSKVVRVVGASTDTTVKTAVEIGENAVLKANYGVLVYYNGTASYGVVIDFYGEFVGITGNGTSPIWNYGSTGITINGTVKATSGNVPVINIYEGAKITAVNGSDSNINDAAGPAIYAAGYGVWNISGGEFTGNEALSIKSGEWNISGGKFTATGDAIGVPIPEGSASETTGATISITANTGYAKNVTLNITGGTFESEDGLVFLETKSNDTSSAVIQDGVTITGGTFEGDFYSEYLTGFIVSGTVETTVDSKYIADDSDFDTTTGVVREQHAVLTGGYSNGTLSVDNVLAYKGDTITITLNPSEGYYVKSLVVTDENNNDIKVTDNKFTMPDAEVTVNVVFAEIPAYGLTLKLPENGSINVSAEVAYEGDEITVTTEPNEGYVLNKIIVTTASGEEVTVVNGKFEMPAEAVVVTAEYIEEELAYSVTVETSENGEIVVAPLNAYEGDEVTVTVTANEGYELKEIKVVDASGKEIEVTDGKFEMPKSNVTVSAVFTEIEEEVPNTIDNISIYVVMGIASLSALVFICTKKKIFN